MPRTAQCCAAARVSLASSSDQDLVEAIRRGSEAHFNELYRRYFQRIYSFTFARVRNHADTEELVQEAFTAAFRSIDSFGGRSSLASWLYGIAKNTINNHLRRTRSQKERLEAARPTLVEGPSAFCSCTPEEQLVLRRYAEAMSERLTQIAAWQVEVFMLRHVENLPIAEIAQRTSRSNDAVRSSLYRVKRLLVEAGQPEPVPAGL